uniref:Uncharacterized protein n=1 Tax=Anguilla anguilla TaxID=7936 RepID=A0A0E9QHJ5_ANGAN
MLDRGRCVSPSAGCSP